MAYCDICCPADDAFVPADDDALDLGVAMCGSCEAAFLAEACLGETDRDYYGASVRKPWRVDDVVEAWRTWASLDA